MTRTYLSAVFVSPDHTSAIAQTVEAGAVAVSQTDTPNAWAAMLEAVTPAPYAPLPAQLPQDVSFWQFMLAAASLGIITLAEAEAAVDTRAMPALFAATLDELPEPARTMARIKYKGITRVVRSDDLFALMVAANIATDAQIDGVFAVAATIT